MAPLTDAEFEALVAGVAPEREVVVSSTATSPERHSRSNVVYEPRPPEGPPSVVHPRAGLARVREVVSTDCQAQTVAAQPAHGDRSLKNRSVSGSRLTSSSQLVAPQAAEKVESKTAAAPCCPGLEMEEAMRRCAAIEAPYWEGVTELSKTAADIRAATAAFLVPFVVRDETFDRQALQLTALEELRDTVWQASHLIATTGLASLEAADRARIVRTWIAAELAQVASQARFKRRVVEFQEESARSEIAALSRLLLRVAMPVQSMETHGRRWWISTEARARADVETLRRYTTAKRVLELDEAYWRYHLVDDEARQRQQFDAADVAATAYVRGQDAVLRPARAARVIVRFLRRVSAQRTASRKVQAHVSSRRQQACEAFFAELGLSC